jgi:hypothetical protein
VAALLIALTYSSIERAFASTTAANIVTYQATSVPANGDSALYTIPGTNVPVLICATTKTNNATVGDQRGTGQVSVTYLDTTTGESQALAFAGITWSGRNVGVVGAGDVDIIRIGEQDYIRTALDPATGKLTKFKIHNYNSSGPVSVVLTIIY